MPRQRRVNEGAAGGECHSDSFHLYPPFRKPALQLFRRKRYPIPAKKITPAVARSRLRHRPRGWRFFDFDRGYLRIAARRSADQGMPWCVIHPTAYRTLQAGIKHLLFRTIRGWTVSHHRRYDVRAKNRPKAVKIEGECCCRLLKASSSRDEYRRISFRWLRADGI